MNTITTQPVPYDPHTYGSAYPFLHTCHTCADEHAIGYLIAPAFGELGNLIACTTCGACQTVSPADAPIVRNPWADPYAYGTPALYPLSVMRALRSVADDPRNENGTVEVAWSMWRNMRHAHVRRFRSVGYFLQALERVTGTEWARCDDCADFYPADEMGGNGETCERCMDNYSHCEDCNSLVHNDELHSVRNYYYVCSHCFDYYYFYCDRCDDYFHEDDDHDHDHDCDCSAPHLHFGFPCNGATVQADERVAIDLPGGCVPAEAINRIYSYLYAAQNLKYAIQAMYEQGKGYIDIHTVLESVGDEWTTKAGTFPKRVGKAFYQHGCKLTNEQIADIGNLARAQVTTDRTVYVEVTRNLNGSAGDFYHAGSCWWGEYAESRCALKNWGGIGLRSYGSADDDQCRPNGRAWIQPLTRDLKPTHDVNGAHAFIVYNGYGALEGYVAARIVAQMTGRSYAKVPFDVEEQYINSSVGYLIADVGTCEDYLKGEETLTFSYDVHDRRDAHTLVSA